MRKRDEVFRRLGINRDVMASGMVDLFKLQWCELAAQYKVDDWGSREMVRVFELWAEEVLAWTEAFILKQANAGYGSEID
jgi:hypothetical protein